MRNPDAPVTLAEFAHQYAVSLMHLERRTEPFWRPTTNAVFREPCAAILQKLINFQRHDEGLALAEERELPGEKEALDGIIRDMGAYMSQKYRNGEFERVGNTKTHGLVRADFIVHDDMALPYRQGLFQKPRTYPAWVRFSGPGPDSPPDIDDVGFMSMSVKVMGVSGKKVLDDEKLTQDFLSVCTPTFVTPDVVANAQLQAQLRRRTPLVYFFDPRHPHVLDFLMQSLWNETQTSPLECQYYSCTPFRLGLWQAMQFSFRPKSKLRSQIPNLPRRPPDHYLRNAMTETLRQSTVEFDMLVQVQTDAHAMPIENAAVRWPEKLSPFVRVATLRIHQQEFNTPAQLEFAKVLRFTPWHCLEDHRPLGNQNRARRRMYEELSKLRLTRNGLAHVEPNGSETFETEPAAPMTGSRAS